ncbi:TetR/AcrR family transcriptional regulator [Homoserinimonas aerilata]|uniref:TetR/AcrR family transcriptional regulator n=1 Tax=Homoserinimonas aerilata TaxID=1162970 RepID=UPI001639F0C2|nr:TetR/AcrR family transcriptional regulator [Homoserinimonas aerilata]
MPGTLANLRNEPVQARSTARLTRLLDSAAEVIEEIGYERLTTAMVAERAGASIGTVYRYFPDRIAVLQSLSARFVGEYIDEVGAALQNPKLSGWADAVDAVIDVSVASFRSKPGFRSIRFGDVIDVRPVEGGTQSAVVAEHIADVLSERFGLEGGKQLAFRVEVGLQVIDSLLGRAFLLRTKGDEAIIAEARAIVRQYFAGFYGDAA